MTIKMSSCSRMNYEHDFFYYLVSPDYYHFYFHTNLSCSFTLLEEIRRNQISEQKVQKKLEKNDG